MIRIQIKILLAEVLNDAGFFSKSNNRMQAWYKSNRHTQTNADIYIWCHIVSSGHNELKSSVWYLLLSVSLQVLNRILFMSTVLILVGVDIINAIIVLLLLIFLP